MALGEILKGAIFGDHKDASKIGQDRKTLSVLGQNKPAAPQPGSFVNTGLGEGLPGGSIAARVGTNGKAEFSNSNQDLSTAGIMPQGGLAGGILKTPGVSNIADDVALERRGAISNVGNGIGTFSQAQAGDSKLALDRFDRANQERARMIESSRTGEPNSGLTIVADSSRSPTLGERQRARLDEREAKTDLLRASTQDTLSAGAMRLHQEQMQRQMQGIDMQAAQLGLDSGLRNEDLRQQLTDPNLPQDQRAGLERNYLLSKDPAGYMAHQARTGLDQFDLVNKQLQQQVLLQKLNPGAGPNAKLTEQQSKDLTYFARGNEANAQLARQGDALTSRASGERGSFRGKVDTVIRGTPLVGDSALANQLVSTERQQAEQSGRELLASILRKDTGAAITDQEMKIYGKMYLPQTGDSDEVLNQKAEARTRALGSIRGGLGNAQDKAAPLADGRRQSAPPAAQPTRVNSRQEVEALPSGSLFTGPDGVVRRKP